MLTVYKAKVLLTSILLHWVIAHQPTIQHTVGPQASHASTSESTKSSTGNQSVSLHQKQTHSLPNQTMVSPNQWSAMQPTSDAKLKMKITILLILLTDQSSNTLVVMPTVVMVTSQLNSSHTKEKNKQPDYES